MSLEKRADLISYAGMIFVAGWLCSSGFYQLPKLWQAKDQLQHVQAVTIPKLKASRDCEHVRADVATGVAVEAIASAEAAGAAGGPTTDDLPANCPPPPPIPKPLPKK